MDAMDLFENAEQKNPQRPLALRLSPRTLEEYVGQEHLTGPGRLLRRLLESNRVISLILYGPPGTGKTAFARLVARQTHGRFKPMNAVTSGVAEIREALEEATEAKRLYGHPTVLFLDEIHHFNKSQQDALLPAMEQGVILLVGATTQNPYFSLNRALLSRSRVCELKPLEEKHLSQILDRALSDSELGLGSMKIDLSDEARRFLIRACSGDARNLLNALEVGALTTSPDESGSIHFDLDVAQQSIQKRSVAYDASGDEHYDTISAFIKSVRGSDPDAALYWLAKMLYAGEDPRFITRRLIILASEDVGNADPQALSLAVSAHQALEFLGLPEGRIPLAQATVFLACAPKSNACYAGFEKALEDVEKGKTIPVPDSLKDAHGPGNASLSHGVGYQYAHDFPNHYVQQNYAPGAGPYYLPTQQGYESKIKKWLDHLKSSPTAPRAPDQT